MKKFLSLIFVLITQCAFAESWQENWAMSKQCINHEDFDGSLKHLEIAVKDVNVDPAVYVDKAHVLLYKNKIHEAEKDIDFALQSGKLSRFDQPRAHQIKSMILLEQGKEQEGFEHFKIFREKGNFPQITETQESAIIRNISANQMTKEIYFRIYNFLGKCESIDDVTIIDEATLMIKKKITESLDCGCGCRGANKQEFKEKFGHGSDCYWACEMSVYYGSQTCAKMLTPVCQVLCFSTLAAWTITCNNCCEGGNYYEKCVRPFLDLVNYMRCENCFLPPSY